jgi:hypothetical protein
LFDKFQSIPEFYPRVDTSKPNLQVKSFYSLFRRKNWGEHLIKKLAKEPLPIITTFFATAFTGALCLFMIELGLAAGKRLRDAGRAGLRLLILGCIIPVLHGALGVFAGLLAGLSPGGAVVLGAMAGSASYIAAPAAVRVALPGANPAYYLTLALGITFPFNLAFGIPLLQTLAHHLSLWL